MVEIEEQKESLRCKNCGDRSVCGLCGEKVCHSFENTRICKKSYYSSGGVKICEKCLVSNVNIDLKRDDVEEQKLGGE